MSIRRIDEAPRDITIYKKIKPDTEEFLKSRIQKLNQEIAQLKQNQSSGNSEKDPNENSKILTSLEEKLTIEKEENAALKIEADELEQQLDNSKSRLEILTQENARFKKELETASKRIEPLQKSLEDVQAKNKELKATLAEEPSFPEEVLISKIGKYMIEDDGTIFIACKVKTKEDGPLSPTTICGKLGAFTALQEKAQAASDADVDVDNEDEENDDQ